MKLAILPIIIISGLLLPGCGSSSGSGGGSGSQVQSNMITIDNAGTVPILNGGTTTTVIYVHNNSTLPINGITYTADVNTIQSQTGSFVQKIMALAGNYSSFLNPNSTAICANLAPGASCPIEFTTPPLTNNAGQGSATITASYSVNGVSASFNQIVNFQQVDNPKDGVNFASGVNISGFDHPTGYATVYLYAGGTDQIYNVNTLTSDKYAVKIVNGNISGQDIASGFVQAIEVSSPIPQNDSIAATLTMVSNNSTLRQSFTSTSSIGVQPVNSGGILVAGILPVINTAGSSNPSGSLTVLNSGNAALTLTGVTANVSAISNLSGCSSGTLNVGQTCTITFNVTQTGGSGIITVNYTGASASSVSQAATWYNSLNGALVSMSYSTPLSFPQNTLVNNLVTVTNIGGYNLTGLTVIPSPFQVFGSATATATYPSNNSCANATLNVGASCQFYVSITDTVVETNAEIVFGVQGTYIESAPQTYNRYAVLTYTSVPLAPNLLITPSPANTMTIQGNNVESASQTLVVSNAGNVAATISSQGMESTNASLFTPTSACGASLESNLTCNVTIKLNPYSASTTVTGTGTYFIQYQGGSSSTLTSTDSIPFTITPNQQSISMTQESVTGSSSGNGTSATPYSFQGNTQGQVVTLTFTNSGSNPIKVTGIQDANSTIAWQLNLAQSTCYSSNNLAPNGTCTIVYTNVLNQNTLAISGLGSSYTENLIVPTITFDDTTATGTQFQVQPTLPSPNGTTTLYATASLATIANSVIQNGANTQQVTVKSVLTNATNYTPITMTVIMEDYFSSVLSTTGSCSQSSASSIRTQTCALQTSNATGSITYQVESAFTTNQAVTLHSLFQMNSAGQAVGMNPLYTSYLIPKQ